MLLVDYVAQLPPEKEVIFEYCYLDGSLQPVAEEALGYSGTAGAFKKTMEQKSPMVLRLYATCGECNDFAVIEDTEKRTVLRYIDFR